MITNIRITIDGLSNEGTHRGVEFEGITSKYKLRISLVEGPETVTMTEVPVDDFFKAVDQLKSAWEAANE